ncbi:MULTISPECIES: phospholipase [Legionella]|uniref:Phospholipase n=1 Tax=Legionella resiliens TaxID=2905958 RepID=A0ABS8WZV0_9GAMM|nr:MULTISPECIES: phospholipase [unclassified Legionella]MCE0722840.1 phospholipase [Legionella sp. 9fVS26]MCE3531993.1 phospholipase [Legionella sp. 8cVS16]QLZ68110.1 hypothetical protein FOLKNPGA_00888 [Legionella sp. PC1000]
MDWQPFKPRGWGIKTLRFLSTFIAVYSLNSYAAQLPPFSFSEVEYLAEQQEEASYLGHLPSDSKQLDHGFALSEHLAAGQQVALLFEPTKSPETNGLLHLRNGLKLTYGNILSLGDLCGIVGQPISLGKTPKERHQRFLNTFYSFAKEVRAVDEVNQLTHVIEQELQAIQTGMQHGETPEVIYQRIGNEVGRQVNCITGGGCLSWNWWVFPGRYLKLAMENYDHFIPNAQIAYLSGHQAALSQALKARETGLRQDLELAYAMDAFACHFLSDHFAAGHLRTPRIQLAQEVYPSLLGSLLASYMHNEENREGLHVHNENQEHWIVYGDFSYFNPANEENRNKLARVLQQSADDVFNTYHYGIINDYHLLLASIPEADENKDEHSMDISPLFYWDERTKQLLRRKDISNPYDRRFTANWWGWSTFISLKRHYGMTQEMRSMSHLLEHNSQEQE